MSEYSAAVTADAHHTGPAPRTSGRLPRVVLLLVGLAAAFIAIQGVKEVRDFVAPVFLALNLIIAVDPVKRWLVSKHLPKWVGAIITGLLVVGILFLFFLSLGWAVAVLAEELPAYRDQFTEFYHSVIDLLASFGFSENQLQDATSKIDPGSVLELVQKTASGLSDAMSLFVIGLTVLVFLVMDSIGFGLRLDAVDRHHPAFGNAIRSFADGVRRYWVVTTVFGLIVALIDYVALVALGVPLAVVWAVVSFITNYIPNIGFVLGLIPPALMALLDKGPVAALIVVIVYSVANFVVQSLIQPKFAGDAVGVTPTVSFLSLLFWSYALGTLGALLALPATLLVKAIFIDEDPKARWFNALIASDIATADEPSKDHDEPEPGPGPDPDQPDPNSEAGDDEPTPVTSDVPESRRAAE